MAYDDLKRIAGVRVGALPQLFSLGGSKTVAPATRPQVIPSPASALKLALGRSGARDLRVAVLSPTRAAPVAAMAASVLGSSTASAAIGSAAAAPAPAPMPMLNAVPASLANIAAAAAGMQARGLELAPLAPPTHDSRDDPAPILASSPAPSSAIVPSAPAPPLVVDYHGDDAPALAAKPLLAALPAGPISNVIRKAAQAPAPARTFPGAGSSGEGARSFTAVDRSAPSKIARGSLLFNGSASRGFSDVQRAPSASRTNDRTTTKGRSIMASRYKGTGEVTYCPFNSDGPINAGASSTLPGIRPQKPFQSQELLIDGETGATFSISDIKIGNEPVGVAAGSVSAANFPPANGPKFAWKVADGVVIIFSVENTGTLTVAFTAMLVGEVCEPIA